MKEKKDCIEENGKASTSDSEEWYEVVSNFLRDLKSSKEATDDER